MRKAKVGLLPDLVRRLKHQCGPGPWTVCSVVLTQVAPIRESQEWEVIEETGAFPTGRCPCDHCRADRQEERRMMVRGVR